MATSDKLTITEFDFNDVKDNLKVFLKAQDEFTDYDFEGSGMSVLLDVLAYNTHYLGYNANMLANEMFLDTATLRGSVSSHAKTLGYLPTSSRAAKATVDISLDSASKATATMSAGTAFTATVDSVSYQFVTHKSYTSSNTGSGVPFNNIPLYEGTYVSSRYTVDTSDSDQRFLISSPRADISTLTVKVQTSSSDSTELTYTLATDITGLTTTSTVYFLQEAENGKYELYFGDGILGKALADGNIIILSYVVTNKAAANGASIFTAATGIDSVTDISVVTSIAATGGAEPESIASIKFNAPLDYGAQGRAVTSEDYKVIVRGIYNDTKSIQVWGGESGSYDPSQGVLSTPEYGKVFISIKTTTGQNLTSVEKAEVVTELAKYKVASITPVIVDPETSDIILNVAFKYDSSATTETNSGLKTLVTNTITTYNNDNLNQFDGIFRHSKLSRLIDDTHPAILSNITNVTLGKYITPSLSQAESYTIVFNNNFYNPYSGYNKEAGGIIASTGFKINTDTVNTMYFNDDGVGNLRVFYLVEGAKVYYDLKAGTVDYLNGTISVNSIFINQVSNVDGVASTKIRITVIPDSKDVVPVRNQVLEIDFVNTTVVGEEDTIAVSDAAAGSTYTTSSTYSTTSSY